MIILASGKLLGLVPTSIELVLASFCVAGVIIDGGLEGILQAVLQASAMEARARAGEYFERWSMSGFAGLWDCTENV